MNDDLITTYNYDEFIPAKFEPWLRFNESPAVGVKIADFELWRLDQTPTSLSELLESHRYTVIEFGSFT